MATNINAKIGQLPRAERAAVEARARELIAEEMTLRELRRALGVTQADLGEKLGIAQEGVSRIERREDLRVSTLRKVVDAMGGELEMVVRFPGRAPIVLRGVDHEL